MDRKDVLSFLGAVDAALLAHANPGERLEVYLLGRSALIVR